MAEDTQNIRIQEQLNEALLQRITILEQINEKLTEQFKIFGQITESAKNQPNYDSQTKSLQDLVDALDDAKQESDKLDTETDDLDKALKQLEGSLRRIQKRNKTWADEMVESGEKLLEMNKTVVFATGFADGFVQQFRGLIAIGKGVTSTFMSIAGSIFNFASSIIAVPFKIFSGIIDMAQSMSGGTEFAQAREEVRKQFGDLTTGIGKNIMKSEKNMRGMMESGNRAFRIFGTRAEQLKEFTDIFVGMGAVANVFGQEIEDNAEAIAQYRKGLGISFEQMKFIGLEAKVSGRSMSELMNQMTVVSGHMAAKFNMEQKSISRDMAEMMADTKHYTSLTVDEMARASVYVRKLGLEIKDVAGILDKFDNFNDAAVAASNLAQGFGLSVDALDMMKEASPDKRIDMLRKSMAAAGKDAANMSRQELAMLAANTGLDESTAKLAFSMKNQGVSMEDLQKQQEKSKTKTMTQEEALQSLAKSMERMIKSGQQLKGGFFSMFAQGFESGVRRSYPFRMMLRSLRRSLRVVFWAGRRLGRIFVDSFPGVGKMIGAFRDFFNPGRFRALMHRVVDQFRAFFADLSDPAKAKDAVKNLLENIRNIFIQFFGEGGGPLSVFLEGFTQTGKAISNILVGAFRYAWEGIKPILMKITDNLKARAGRSAKRKEIAEDVKKKGLTGAEANAEIERQLNAVAGPQTGIFDGLFDSIPGVFSGIFAEIGSIMGEIMQPIYDYFGDPAVQAELAQVLYDFFAWALFSIKDTFVKNVWEPYGTQIILGLAAWLAGGAAIKGALTVAGTQLGGLLMVGIGKAFGGKSSKDKLVNSIDSLTKTLASSTNALTGGVAQTAALDKASRTIKPAQIFGKIAAIAGGLAVAGVMLAAALVLIRGILFAGGISTFEDAALPLTVLGAAVLGTAGLAKSVSLVQNMKSIFGKIFAIASGLAVGGVALATALILIRGMLSAGGINTLEDASLPLTVLGAAVLGTALLTRALSRVWYGDPGKIALNALSLAGLLFITGSSFGLALRSTVESLKDLKDNEVYRALAVVLAAAVASLPIALSVSLVSKVVNAIGAGNLMKGLVLIGMLMIGMSVLMAIIIGFLATTDSEKLRAIGEFMANMTLVVLGMIPLVAGAAALGFALANPIGLAALGTGMAILAGAIVSITGAAITILSQLNEMKIVGDPATFKIKIDAFVSIVHAINDFTGKILDIMRILQPRLFSFGLGSDISQNLNSATDFVGQLIGNKSGGTGIIGLVETLVDAVDQLKSVENINATTQAFVNIVGAVGSVLGGIGSAINAFKEKKSKFNFAVGFGISSGAESDETLDAAKAGAILTAMFGGMKGFFTEITTSITSLLPLMKDIPSPEMLGGIAQIISAYVQLTSALQPNAETINAFKTITKNSETSGGAGWTGFSAAVTNSEKEAVNVTGYLKAVVNNKKQIESLITTVSGAEGPIATLVNSLKDMDPEKLKHIGAIGTIIKSFSEIIKVVSDSSKEVIEEVEKGPMSARRGGRAAPPIGDDTRTVITRNIERSGNIIDLIGKIGPSMSGLMETLITATQKIPTDENFGTQANRAKDLFAMLTEVVKLTESISKLQEQGLFESIAKTGASLFGFSQTKVSGSFDKIITVLNTLIGTPANSPLDKMITSAKTIDEKLSTEALDKTNTVEKVGNFLRGMIGIADSIKSLTDWSKKNTIEKNNLGTGSSVIPTEGLFSDGSAMMSMQTQPNDGVIQEFTFDMPKDFETSLTNVGTLLDKLKTSNVFEKMKLVKENIEKSISAKDSMKTFETITSAISSLQIIASTATSFQKDYVSIDLTTLSDNLDNAVLAIDTIAAAFAPKQLLTNVTTSTMKHMEHIKNHIPTIVETMDMITTKFKDPSKFRLPTVSDAILETFGGADGEDGPEMAKKLPVVRLIASMVAAHNQIAAQLNGIGDINIESKLKTMGKFLGFDDKKFSLNDGNVNITINLKVEMDAAKLATVLVEDTKYVGAGTQTIPGSGSGKK